MAQTRLNLPDAFERALAYHRSGDLGQAERLYRAILAENATHGGALHRLGLIAHQCRRSAAALDLIDQAIASGPVSAEMLTDRGIILATLHRPEEALVSFERAAALQPNLAERHFNYGNALNTLKRFAAALASYDRALALRPNYIEALNNRGLVLHALERFEEALASYDRVLALRPDFVEILNNRGMTLGMLQRFEEALASYDTILARRPNEAETHYGRANMLKSLGRFEEALTGYDRALALRPDYAEAHNNRGNAARALRRFEEALASYGKALALRPDFAEAHNNRGLVLQELNQFEAALVSCEHALALRPNFAEAHNNRGFALRELNRFEAALASYERALALRPDYADAHWNEAICRLLLGDFACGWLKYEWRWKVDRIASKQRNFSSPLWLGKEDLTGKTILLHAEQGFGDTIQFCRYVPLVAATGATVILEVQSPLVPLLRDLAGVVRLAARGDELPDFDCHCPLLSLPLALGTRLETIPAPIPYLYAEPNRIEKFATLLPPASFRVGLVWSGRPSHARDRLRSIALERLDPIVGLAEIGFVSLQRDVRPEDEAALTRRPAIVHLGDRLDDFADTAAAVATLDLVITVDTAIAHLAGAMGKPVWILLPYALDWRWMLDREDSPWYPSAHLFRQPQPDDWDTVIARARDALMALAQDTVMAREQRNSGIIKADMIRAGDNSRNNSALFQ